VAHESKSFRGVWMGKSNQIKSLQKLKITNRSDSDCDSKTMFYIFFARLESQSHAIEGKILPLSR
jgi:hypothetical protein